MASMNNQGGASSSSATFDFAPYSWSYDVFLSFRGEDTRYGFTGHLHSALLRKGINTFIDNDLTKGDEIARSLLKVIEESRISVIVFSENYASSKWCLDELVHIHHCNESKQQMVRPVFYKVDPADVRYQKGSYGEALAKHERRFPDNLEKVGRWRTALTRSANLSGWHYKEQEYESKFINKIVEEISVELVNHTYLDVAEFPIGIQSRVHNVEELLGVCGNLRCIVGIWGGSGIGKTTIAKAVYNSIGHRFQGSCFLENVGEKSMSPEGLVNLQETLLSDILGGTSWKVGNVHKGINVIKQRLSNKRILLVLDDVNKLDWLATLTRATGLFGEGSRVIVTTTDKGLLTRHGIKSIYEVKRLDYQQAIELFSWHAFGKYEPPLEYVALTSRVVDYVQCLPLALKVLGTHLGTLETTDRWQATLDNYKSAPYKEIQKPFRICYDALDYEVREVFLDIACFFNGRTKDFVNEILKEDDELDFPEYCIEVLKQRALISLDRFGRISMHNLLEKMGKDIAREESLTEPGEHKRLWFHRDVLHVLNENIGTNKIKGIMAKFPKPVEISLSAKSFSGMTNLKYFININACFSGYLDYLPNSLKLIDWGRCQFQSFPSNFRPQELIMLNMPFSHITLLGEEFKYFKRLTSVNFEGCEFVKHIPDLSGISNLKVLRLSYCTGLVEIDPSVGFLEKLVNLDLNGCSNLKKFPERLGLRSLERLSLTNCKKLKKFPEVVDKMEFLTQLLLGGTSIKELPSSICYLSGLESLNADNCTQLENLPCSIYELQHLRYLRLDHCPKLVTLPNKAKSEVSSNTMQSFPKLVGLNFEGCLLSDSDFFAHLDCLSTLYKLYLSRSNFVSLPLCISKFVNLSVLELFACYSLRSIFELPPTLRSINVVDCILLETFSALSKILELRDTQLIERMDLSSCPRLCDNLGFDVAKMAYALLNQVKNSLFEVVFLGNEVPKWFNCCKDVWVVVYDDEGDQLICELVIEIPPNFKWENTGLAFCVVFESTEECAFTDHIMIDEHSMPAVGQDLFFISQEAVRAHVWLKYIPLALFVDMKSKMDKKSLSMPYVCRVMFYREYGRGLLVKSCGVHLAGMPHNDGDYQDENGDNDQHHQEQQLISFEERNPPNDKNNYEDEGDEEFYSCHSSDENEEEEEVCSVQFRDKRFCTGPAAKEFVSDTGMGLQNPKKRTWEDYNEGHSSAPASPSAPR